MLKEQVEDFCKNDLIAFNVGQTDGQCKPDEPKNSDTYSYKSFRNSGPTPTLAGSTMPPTPRGFSEDCSGSLCLSSSSGSKI